MRWIVVLGLAIAPAGCITDQLVPCGDRACAVGEHCVANECANDAQIAACDGLAPGDVCTTDRIPHGYCVGTAGAVSCQASTCGNGVLEQGEVCDDGNVTSGDGCSGDCQSNETCGNDYVDGIVGEQCDSGVPFLSGDGCTSLCTVESDDWHDATPTGFSERVEPALAYDPTRKRVVLFGGTDLGSIFGDTWEWDGTSWEQRFPAASPPARFGAAIAYDPGLARVIMFGGGDFSQLFSDTWSYDGVTWTQLSPATSPGGHAQAPMTWDATQQRLVLFGGLGPNGNIVDDTWLFDGATWTAAMPATVPPPRQLHAAAFDTVSGHVVMFGGLAGTGIGQPRLGDTWEWDGTNWTAMSNTGATPREAAAMATDPVTGRVVMLGGRSDDMTYLGDGLTWTGSWSAIPAPPPARAYAPMVTDTQRGHLVLVAGVRPPPVGIITETWERAANGQWAQLPPDIEPPPTTQQAMTYDAARGRVVMFGGNADVWEWDNTWHRVVVAGPMVRAFPGLSYDEAHRTTVMFGGANATTTFGDTWLWNGAVWTVQTPLVAPPARSRHGMVYDPIRREVVVFGGVDNSGTALSDTWTWDGTTWHEKSPQHVPPAQAIAQLAFDRARRVTVLLDDASEVWTWDGSDWTQHQPTVSPPALTLYELGYDVNAQRVVRFGGEMIVGMNATYYADTWAWDGTSWSRRMPADDPGPRAGGAIAFDARHGRLVEFGGRNAAGPFATTWTYGFAATATPPDRCVAGVDTDGDGRAGCDDPDCWARCTPMCAPAEVCDDAFPHCGDGTCSPPLEDYTLCPADCAPP